jgi:hypothetical protein
MCGAQKGQALFCTAAFDAERQTEPSFHPDRVNEY